MLTRASKFLCTHILAVTVVRSKVFCISLKFWKVTPRLGIENQIVHPRRGIFIVPLAKRNRPEIQGISPGRSVRRFQPTNPLRIIKKFLIIIISEGDLKIQQEPKAGGKLSNRRWAQEFIFKSTIKTTIMEYLLLKKPKSPYYC